ncbi:hypothetical protein [Halococcoides cellulosivorans]|uniref:N-acetyltransferase domain-containing protein n=1 Tax=Halococcoides cellulosivorans TaxID=1679096 RepID=A0A2R4WXY2_9EURY|nr:hypothetical protein [Halococcoides cellulosivorans]AWB26397.1 hypothetical protein HARCEL1_01000 [Halococcoides cellulosivorans]
MDIRDAVEADAETLANLTDSPRDVMVNLIHDRTVRVAEDDESIRGFVSFDARDQTVHVTQLDGAEDACDRLLDEPVRFARQESMRVEVLIPQPEQTVRDVVSNAGFERVGTGPQFEGVETVRYRLDTA